MLPDLAVISAGSRPCRAWNSGDALVSVSINFLEDEHEAFCARNLTPLSGGIIRHIVGIGGAGKTSNHFAGICVQRQLPGWSMGSNEQTVVLFSKRHREIGSSFLKLAFFPFSPSRWAAPSAMNWPPTSKISSFI